MLGLTPRTIQRWRAQGGGQDGRNGPRTAPANKLSDEERRRVLAVVSSREFRDLPPEQIVAALADREVYLASASTMYRLLREADQLKHRETCRKPAPRPKAHRATGPGQVWSWDITYLRSAARGTFYYLYLFMDVWSRKIVGFNVHDEESMDHAATLARRLARREGIDPDQLVLHSDNGGPMKGATMRVTLDALGITASFSRPRVSNDNPYSEALFRTLKYRPEYPSQPFDTLAQARAWVGAFVDWYNLEHRHSAIRYVTPDQRHSGAERAILQRRRALYAKARARHPERWSRQPRNWNPVLEVELNPEKEPVALARTERLARAA